MVINRVISTNADYDLDVRPDPHEWDGGEIAVTDHPARGVYAFAVTAPEGGDEPITATVTVTDTGDLSDDGFFYDELLTEVEWGLNDIGLTSFGWRAERTAWRGRVAVAPERPYPTNVIRAALAFARAIKARR